MKFIDHLEGIVASKIEVIKGICTLFKLEAKLAGSSIIPMLVSVGAMIALIMTVWLTGMLLIGYLVTISTGGYVSIGILLVLFLNLGLFVYTLKFMGTSLRHMSFERTRASLSSNKLLRDDDEFSKQSTSFDS